MPSFGRRSLVAGALAVAVLAALLTTPGEAAAEGTVIVPIQGLDVPLQLDTNNNVSYPPAADGTQTAPQCFGTPSTDPTQSNLCVGAATSAAQTPTGAGEDSDLYGLVKHNNEARDALDWIVAEGKESVRAMYDIPADERIERYARRELRAYMLDRLLDIMDRKVYGVPLTPDETAALDFVTRETLADDLTLRQAAWDEFESFQNLHCNYFPPPKPVSFAEAVPRPKKLRDWCAVAHHPSSEAFIFAPPIPSVEEFEAWGGYAANQELGLDVMAHEDVADITRDAALGLVALGGLATAIGAATAVGAIVGASTSLATGMVALIGSSAGATTFIPGAAPAITGSVAGVGGAAAASVVAIVVVFVIVTAVSIFLLVENESIGKTLKRRLDTARTNTDPFGFLPLYPELAGKPLRSEFDPENPPTYRDGISVSKLLAQVVKWTSIEQPGPVLGGAALARTEGAPSIGAAEAAPTVIDDPEGLWSGNSTKASDIRFQTRTGTGDWVNVNQITVPQKPGPATVRFSRRWMITDTAPEEPEAGLTFGYINADGNPRLAARAPSTLGGFIVTDPAAAGGAEGVHVMSIAYRNANDVLVRARLRPAGVTYLEGPRPSAVGPLLAGRPVILRPNPVNLDGTSYDLAEAQTDFTYNWTLRRFNSATGQWDVTNTSTAFGPSITPTVTGLYDARVTMESVADPLEKKHGYVSFFIAAPPMAVEPLLLLDNGSTQLEVDLQVTEPVIDDAVTVEVTWPPEFGAESTVTTVQMDCIQTDPLECKTPRTGALNNLIFPLTEVTDLRQPIQVTLTNSFGGVVEQQLFIDSPDRPRVLPPEAGANATMPGIVNVAEGSTQVSMPLREGNSSYVLGTLAPGGAGGDDFGLVDLLTHNTTSAIPVPGMEQVLIKVDERDDGTWELLAEGIPHVGDIGSHQVPVVIAQTNTNRTAIMVVIHVVASVRERFRGGIQSPVDPANFAVATLPNLRPAILGGRAEWAAYNGNMCVTLQYKGFPTSPVQKCGPRSAFFTADGLARRFPYAELFPTGMREGPYVATAKLTLASARVDNVPLQTSFLLTEDATYPKPQVSIRSVVVRGTPKVGERLRAVVGVINPTDATVTYRWLRDGNVMSGYTSRTYLVRPSDAGHRLAVVVTAKKLNWVTATLRSVRTPVITQ